MIKTWQTSQQLIHQRDTHISLETEKLLVCGSSALRNRQLFPSLYVFAAFHQQSVIVEVMENHFNNVKNVDHHYYHPAILQ